jgi:hypothetical protein
MQETSLHKIQHFAKSVIAQAIPTEDKSISTVQSISELAQFLLSLSLSLSYMTSQI